MEKDSLEREVVFVPDDRDLMYSSEACDPYTNQLFYDHEGFWEKYSKKEAITSE